MINVLDLAFEHPLEFEERASMFFECSEIVGRKFEDIDDHAGYLREGGCSELIEVLAAV